jgi:hypothetical protein
MVKCRLQLQVNGLAAVEFIDCVFNFRHDNPGLEGSGVSVWKVRLQLDLALTEHPAPHLPQCAILSASSQMQGRLPLDGC